MLLTQCEMVWTVMTFISLSLPVWSAVKVTQPYRVVSTNGTAQIQCNIHPQPPFHQVQPSFDKLTYPFPDPEDLQVTLLKGLHGNQQFCLSILNFTGQETQEEKEGVRCTAQVRGGAVDVTVSGLKTTDTDVYRCVIQVFYPPPYLRLTGNGTLIHVVESSGCPAQEAERQQGKEEQEEQEETTPFSVPVVILIIMIICVLITIICFQTVQCELWRTEVVRVPPTGLLHKKEAVPFPYENMA